MKTKQKRWGKKFVDRRDHKALTKTYVLRGQFFLDLDFVEDWHLELEEMNKNKIGRPYEFPNSLIECQAKWIQHFSYRAAQGITEKIVEYSLLPKSNNYSTISRRAKRLAYNMPLCSKDNLNLSTDGTGMKANMQGEYLEQKHGGKEKKRKPFIKVTITGDPENKDIYKIDVELEGKGCSEPEIAERHMTELISEGKRIDKFYGDGAFDTHKLFDFCDFRKINPIIKIRQNAVVDPGGLTSSWLRGVEVKKYLESGYQKWAYEKGYGKRWVGTEGIFSAVKRIFGEKLRSRNVENMCLEARRRFWVYQKMKGFAEARM